MPVKTDIFGGNVVEINTSEKPAEIDSRRTLMALLLTANAPSKPEIVEGLTNTNQVFAHYNPKIEVEFENEQGVINKEMLHFKGLGDFGIKGITAQSKFLNELNMKREQYLKIIRQLKTNKPLKQALTDKSTKENIMQALQALHKKLEQAK